MKASFCFQAYLTHFKPKFRKSQSFFNKKVLLKFFFSIWVFFHEHSRFTGQQGKGEGIYLTPLYHFHRKTRVLESLLITLWALGVFLLREIRTKMFAYEFYEKF